MSSPAIKPCPDENTLAEFAEGIAGTLLHASVESHVDVCAPCRRVISEYARGLGSVDESPEDDPSAHLESGATIAPYRIGQCVGTGAMGTVYLARDMELDRDVAIKVLHPDVAPAASDEARSLAQISHPNVVAVHQVLRVGSSAAIVMEYIRGETLTEWLLAERRSWRAVAELLMQAAAGLAAAHDAGLLHRDVKPSNLLIDSVGRLRVLDFGLARAAKAPRDAAFAGTPAYAAPELRAESSVGEPADQYSLCLTFAEALTGTTRPGVIRTPPVRGRIPRPVLRAVSRGLRQDPGDRHPNIASLRRAVEAGLQVADRRRTRIRLAVMCSVAALGAAVLWSRTGSHVPDCASSTRGFDGVWSASTRDRLRTHIFGLDVPGAAALGESAIEAIDEFASRWRAQQITACEDTHVRGRQSPQVLTARTLCLDRLRAGLASLIRVLESADPSVAVRAQGAVAELGSPTACADVASLTARPQVPPEKTDAIAKVGSTLASARALMLSGKMKEAQRVATQALGSAQGIEYPPLEAVAALLAARTAVQVGDAQGMLDHAELAYRAAEKSSYDEIRTQAAILLMEGHGVVMGDYLVAQQWRQVAEASVLRIDEHADAELRAAVLNHVGRLLQVEGKGGEAIEHHRRALAVVESELPADDVRLIRPLYHLANALPPGREGLDYATRSRKLAEKKLGTHHPRVAAYLGPEARTQMHLGFYELAMQLNQRRVKIMKRAYGADYPEIGPALWSTAECLRHLGRLEQAEAQIVAALDSGFARDTHNGRWIGAMRIEHAQIRLAIGDLEAAKGHADRGHELMREALGDRHPDLVEVLMVQAAIQRPRAPERALELNLRALELLGEGEDAGLRGRALTALGHSKSALGLGAEAASTYLNAVPMLRKREGTASRRALAEALFGWAKLAVEVSPESARAFAEEAKQVYAGLTDREAQRRVAHWLQGH